MLRVVYWRQPPQSLLLSSLLPGLSFASFLMLVPIHLQRTRCVIVRTVATCRDYQVLDRCVIPPQIPPSIIFFILYTSKTTPPSVIQDDNTPLHAAFLPSHPDAVRGQGHYNREYGVHALLEFNCDPNAQNKVKMLYNQNL